MSSGFAVVRPEGRPPVVVAFADGSECETFVVQVRQLAGSLEDTLRNELAGSIDTQHGPASLAGVVAHGPKVVGVAVEAEIHNSGKAARDSRDPGESAG